MPEPPLKDPAAASLLMMNPQPRKVPVMQLEEHHVFFEAKTRTSLREVLQQLEPWLDRNNIRPIEFKHTVTLSGAIELQLTFKTRDEARLFEQAFCQPSQV